MIDLVRLLADLCSVVPDRRPGSPGNEAAVDRVAALLTGLGWRVNCPRFPVVNWTGQPGTLDLAGHSWPVHPSPYGTGWRGSAPMHPAATEEELAGAGGAILLLHGELASTPLAPTDYPFYGSERDARLVELLQGSGARAVLARTGRAPELAGSLDPFPLVEDGSFPLPTGNLSLEVGAQVLVGLRREPGAVATLDLPARRWPSSARNVVAALGDQLTRVTVVAHIDTKPGTPGALDNATGVVVLCRVAELLADPGANPGIGVELLVVNGEDHYSASGELDYLAGTDLSEVRLAVNIDGAGLRGGPTAYSTYGRLDEPALRTLESAPGLVPGPPWPQSDHMVFAAAGRPAIALTSSDFATVMQDVAHSHADTPDLVDPVLLEQAAQAIARVIRSLD